MANVSSLNPFSCKIQIFKARVSFVFLRNFENLQLFFTGEPWPWRPWTWSPQGVFEGELSFKKMSAGGRLCTLQENPHFWVLTIKVRPPDVPIIRKIFNCNPISKTLVFTPFWVITSFRQLWCSPLFESTADGYNFQLHLLIHSECDEFKAFTGLIHWIPWDKSTKQRLLLLTVCNLDLTAAQPILWMLISTPPKNIRERWQVKWGLELARFRRERRIEPSTDP